MHLISKVSNEKGLIMNKDGLYEFQRVEVFCD